MLGAVLFDLGDTLFDLNTHDPHRYVAPGIEQAYRDLLAQGYRLPPREQYLKRVFRAMTLAYIWSQLTLREIDLLALIRKTHRRWKVDLDRATAERYARACHQPIREVFVAAEGAAGVLERLRQAGYAIGLVSNTFMLSKALDEDLAAAGMLDYFACRVYSADVGVMKPHRRIFETALNGLGVSAAETMFVGDLIDVDVKGAKRLGMTTVLKVADGYLPAGRYRPDYIIRRITELPDLLPRCRARNRRTADSGRD